MVIAGKLAFTATKIDFIAGMVVVDTLAIAVIRYRIDLALPSDLVVFVIKASLETKVDLRLDQKYHQGFTKWLGELMLELLKRYPLNHFVFCLVLILDSIRRVVTDQSPIQRIYQQRHLVPKKPRFLCQLCFLLDSIELVFL